MSAALALPVEISEGGHNALTTMHSIFQAEGLTPAEAWLLSRMAVRCGPRGTHWATHEQIAADTKMSLSTVKRTIRGLQRGGLLLVWRRKAPHGPTPNLPNVYGVNVSTLKKLARQPKAVPTRAAEALEPPGSSGHGDPMQGVTAPCHQVMVTPSKTLLKNSDQKPRGSRAHTPAREATREQAEQLTPLEQALLGGYQAAYEAKYQAPPIQRLSDPATIRSVVAAARQQAEAYQGRCEAQGRKVAPLEELVGECTSFWVRTYMVSTGRPTKTYPEGYLAGRRHPLSCLPGDLETYGTPWSAQEKRLAQAEAEAELKRRWAESDARQREADRKKHELAQQRAAQAAADQATPPTPEPQAVLDEVRQSEYQAEVVGVASPMASELPTEVSAEVALIEVEEIPVPEVARESETQATPFAPEPEATEAQPESSQSELVERGAREAQQGSAEAPTSRLLPEHRGTNEAPAEPTSWVPLETAQLDDTAQASVDAPLGRWATSLDELHNLSSSESAGSPLARWVAPGRLPALAPCRRPLQPGAMASPGVERSPLPPANDNVRGGPQEAPWGGSRSLCPQGPQQAEQERQQHEAHGQASRACLSEPEQAELNKKMARHALAFLDAAKGSGHAIRRPRF